MSERQISVGGSPDNQRFVVTFPRDPLKREFELAVTLRMPPLNSRIPDAELPTLEELEIIQARTILNWSNVMASLIFDVPLPEQRFAGINAVRIDDENELAGIVESDGDMPYCTVFNLTNFYNPGLHITVHSYDDGSIALALAQSYVRGMERFSAYLAKNAESANGGIIRVGMSTKAESPTPDNTNRIGRNADTLPDTNTVNMPNIESKGLRPAMLAPTGSQGDIMFASGKGDTAWKFALWATKKIDYQNKSAIQYADGEIRAYPVTGIEIKDVRGAIVASVKTQMGNIDIWKKKKDSDENTYDWQSFSDGMAQIGILLPQLIAGFKKSFEAIALINISHSEDKTKEWKNFYGFRSMPQSGSTKPHEDLNTFFGAKEAATDDIPF